MIVHSPFAKVLTMGRTLGSGQGRRWSRANRTLGRPAIAGQAASMVLACVVAGAMQRGCIGGDDRARFGDRAAVWTMISK